MLQLLIFTTFAIVLNVDINSDAKFKNGETTASSINPVITFLSNVTAQPGAIIINGASVSKGAPVLLICSMGVFTAVPLTLLSIEHPVIVTIGINLVSIVGDVSLVLKSKSTHVVFKVLVVNPKNSLSFNNILPVLPELAPETCNGSIPSR